MFNRFREWYKSQTGVRKWVLIFILNWLYWATAYGIGHILFSTYNEERHNGRAFLFQTTFMAIFWTLFFDGLISPKLKRKYAERKEADNE
jgi:predicted branched-subunit amino acid permease